MKNFPLRHRPNITLAVTGVRRRRAACRVPRRFLRLDWLRFYTRAHFRKSAYRDDLKPRRSHGRRVGTDTSRYFCLNDGSMSALPPQANYKVAAIRYRMSKVDGKAPASSLRITTIFHTPQRDYFIRVLGDILAAFRYGLPECRRRVMASAAPINI